MRLLSNQKYLSSTLIHWHTILQHSHSSRYQVKRTTPKWLQNFLKASYRSCFVNPLANISFMEMYHRSISPILTCSQMKWCQMSMCFAQEWLTGFWVRVIQPWLLAKMIVAEIWEKSIFFTASSTRWLLLWHLPMPCTLLQLKM